MAIAWLQILPCKHFNMLWRKESELIKLNTTQWMSLAFFQLLYVCRSCCTSVRKILTFWIDSTVRRGHARRVKKVHGGNISCRICMGYLPENIYWWSSKDIQILFAILRLYSIFIIIILGENFSQKYTKFLWIL